MTWRDDDFDELAADLRRRVGAEFIQEAAEIEQLTDLQRRRRADLAEAARAAMHRGDRVTITCPSGNWAGKLAAVGNDYVVLETAELVVEAHLLSVGLEFEPSRSGGRSGTPGSATWRARLTELELEGTAITVMAPKVNTEATGTIEVVASDHVVVETGERRLIVPLPAIAVLLRRP